MVAMMLPSMNFNDNMAMHSLFKVYIAACYVP